MPHLDQRDQAEIGATDHRGPGKEIDRVDGEDHVEKRVEEVAHIGLRPPLTDRVDTAFVGSELRGGRRMWRQQQADQHDSDEEQHACKDDSTNCQIRGHAGHSSQPRGSTVQARAFRARLDPRRNEASKGRTRGAMSARDVGWTNSQRHKGRFWGIHEVW